MTKSDSSIEGCDPGVYSPLEASELAWARVRVRVRVRGKVRVRVRVRAQV